MSAQKYRYGNVKANQTRYPFVLPNLPFTDKALLPHMSDQTLQFHHGKHHNAYVQNLNKLLEGSNLSQLDLEHIILEAAGDKSKMGVFNNAAQVWNHTFFWHSLQPHGKTYPTDALLKQINIDFKDLENFKTLFKEAALGQFGSGWAWLVFNDKDKKLEIVKTANAETPITQEKHALLCCDVWEHAYYLDFQNRRADFVSVFLDHLANWEFAQENFHNIK